MTHTDFIVAIELGSSKVTGMAGKKNPDGSITVLAIAKEESSSFIRNGVVYKIDKTVQCISNIVNKLQNNLKTRITQVYVGVGGQSIHSERNVIIKDLPEREIITHNMIDEIQETNRQMNYPNQYILDCITQEYKVDSLQQTDPVGIQCRHLEANFLNIVCREQFYQNLCGCFEKAGIHVAEMFLSPLALADSVLLDSEKRSGCVLVDLGADTTTVAIYNKNILRHLAVIPLGGINITRDLTSQHIEENVAEQMKLKYGTAYSEKFDSDEIEMYRIDDEKTISDALFNDIVEARVREIIENVNHQITHVYRDYDSLLGGLVLTGGGSNMHDIEKAFTKYTNIQKVRTARFVQHTINSRMQDITSRNAMMNTVLALMAKGYMNCAGGEYNPSDKLFDGNGEANVDVTGPVQIDVVQKREGVVITQQEKDELARKKAEEEERRRQEQLAEEARLKEEQEEAEAEELRRQQEEEKRRNQEEAPLNKAFKGVKRWFNNLISDEE